VAAVGDYDYDDDEIVKDLSKNQWSYKVGLHGEHEMHYSYENSLKTWYTDAVPTDRILVWYKVKLLIVALTYSNCFASTISKIKLINYQLINVFLFRPHSKVPLEMILLWLI